MSPSPQNVFFSRMFFILGGICVCFFILALRLYYLQVYLQGHYQTLSDKNRIHLTPLKPKRGRIYDRKGIVLVDNDQRYHAILDRRRLKNLEEVVQKISTFIELTPEDQSQILEMAEETPVYIPLEIKKNLSWEEVAALEIHNITIPGLEVVISDERIYPHKKITSHVIGYVGKPSKEAVAENILLSLPGMKEGKSGLEKFYQERLQGVFGQLETENNARGHQVRTLSKTPPQKGEDLTLTIDFGLQKYIYELLQQHKSAAAVVLDVETGAIYAMVSVPGYDPNLFSGGISAENWKSLMSSAYTPLMNKAISGLYSPGSLIKVFISTALLADTRIGKDFSVTCTGRYPLGSHIFHCWRRGGHGSISIVRALVESCDVFFYKAVGILGIDKLVEFLSRFRFGEKTGIDLVDEKPGLLPTPAWKKSKGRGRWFPGDTVNLSIGQGDLLSTPIQWAYAMALIANEGKEITPHLTQIWAYDLNQKQKLDKEALAVIKKALKLSVNSQKGTGRHAKSGIPGFLVAGKTSTSQVRRISLAERAAGIRSVEETPWHLRDNAMFVGYAPAHKPKYVLALMVEHGGWGGRTTGPLAKKIFNYIYKNLYKHDVKN